MSGSQDMTSLMLSNRCFRNPGVGDRAVVYRRSINRLIRRQYKPRMSGIALINPENKEKELMPALQKCSILQCGSCLPGPDCSSAERRNRPAHVIYPAKSVDRSRAPWHYLLWRSWDDFLIQAGRRRTLSHIIEKCDT